MIRSAASQVHPDTTTVAGIHFPSHPPGSGLRSVGRSLGRRVAVAATLIWLASLPAVAENITRWTTNYYAVTGATAREIRRSMTASRPWKTSLDADATTTWKVEWKFQFETSATGCRCNGASTVTTIVTTLPRYIPPADASAEAIERWKVYFPILARHEGNHAKFGLSAAAEIEQQLGSIGEKPDCASLQRALNESAHRILQKYRLEERAYDQRTRHGATEGARFP